MAGLKDSFVALNEFRTCGFPTKRMKKYLSLMQRMTHKRIDDKTELQVSSELEKPQRGLYQPLENSYTHIVAIKTQSLLKEKVLWHPDAKLNLPAMMSSLLIHFP